MKALSDVICTSSNAVKIVKALGDQKIVFAPDRHLGAFVARQAGRPDLVCWQGTCIVHETFSERRLLALMAQHPDAEVIAHPECHDGILRHAGHIASTSGLIEHARTSPKQAFIVATEAGILHKMREAAPGKTLIPAPPEDESCSCNLCPYMKRNTLEKLYLALRDLAAAGRRRRAGPRPGAAADPAHARDVGVTGAGPAAPQEMGQAGAMAWKTILVPHDFSTSANHATAIARDEAKLHGGTLVLLHVIELPYQLGPDAVIVPEEPARRSASGSTRSRAPRPT